MADEGFSKFLSQRVQTGGLRAPGSVVPGAALQGPSFNDFLAKRYGTGAAAAPVDPNNPPGTILSRGLGAALDNAKLAYGSTLEGVGKVAGFQSLEDYGGSVAEGATQRLADAAKNMQQFQEIDGVGSFGRYAGEQLVTNAPQIATTTGGSYAGGVAGATAGALAGPAGAAVGGIVGGILGGLAANLPFYYGLNREEQKSALIAKGLKPEVDEGAAILTAIPQSAMDFLADKFLIKGLVPKPGQKLLTRVIKGGAQGALTEAPTEVGQQILQRLQAGEDLWSPEAVDQYIEIAVAAGIVGGGIKAAVSIPASHHPSTPEDTAQLVATDELTDADLGTDPGGNAPAMTLENPLVTTGDARNGDAGGPAPETAPTGEKISPADVQNAVQQELSQSEQAAPIAKAQVRIDPYQQEPFTPESVPDPVPSVSEEFTLSKFQKQNELNTTLQGLFDKQETNYAKFDNPFYANGDLTTEIPQAPSASEAIHLLSTDPQEIAELNTDTKYNQNMVNHLRFALLGEPSVDEQIPFPAKQFLWELIPPNDMPSAAEALYGFTNPETGNKVSSLSEATKGQMTELFNTFVAPKLSAETYTNALKEWHASSVPNETPQELEFEDVTVPNLSGKNIPAHVPKYGATPQAVKGAYTPVSFEEMAAYFESPEWAALPNPHGFSNKENFKKIYTSPAMKSILNSKKFKAAYQGNKIWLDPNTGDFTTDYTGWPFVMWHKVHNASPLPFAEPPLSSLISEDTMEGQFRKTYYEIFSHEYANHGWGGSDTKYGFFMAPALDAWGPLKVGFPLIAKMENPYIAHELYDKSYSGSKLTEVLSKAKDAGHDFVIFPRLHDGLHIATQIVALFGESETKVKHLHNVTGEWKFNKTANFYYSALNGSPSEVTILPEQPVVDRLHEILRKAGLGDKIHLTIFSNEEAHKLGYAGYFTKNGRGLFMGISAANGDPEITMNEEVMHALLELGYFKGVKGSSEYRLLVKAAKDRWIGKYGLRDDPFYGKLSEQDLIHEAIAKAYSDPSLRGEGDSKLAVVFNRIQNFFGALINWARGYGFQTTQDIFRFISGTDLQWEIGTGDTEMRYVNKELDQAFTAFAKLGVKIPQVVQQQKDYYGRLVKQGWTIVQLAKKNLHIGWLQTYTQLAEKWHGEKSKWLAAADETVKKWNGLPADQQDALGRVLFEVEQMTYRTPQEVQSGKARKPTKQELLAIFTKHGLGVEGVRVYVQVRHDFDTMLNKIEQVTMASIARDLANNPIATMLEQAKAKKEFDTLRTYPYFPHSRFGNYTIIVKDGKGQTVYAEMFETEKARNAAMAGVKSKFGSGFTVSASKLSEEAQIYKGLPHALLVQLKSTLKLDPKQLAALDDLLVHTLPSVSFKNHFVKKENIAGYSKDALRAYADYFFHGANHIARIEYSPQMEETILTGQNNISDMILAGEDSTDRVKILDHVKSHYEGIMNPQPDWAAVRSIGFLMWLGFNVKSAVVNFTQVPLVTYAHLGAHFGDLKATGTLASTMKNIMSYYRSPAKAKTPQSQADSRLIQLGIEQGFLDESFAATLAGIAESGNLVGLKVSSKARKAMIQFNTAASYMFQTVEKLNRRVSFMAAANLARANPNAAYLNEVRTRFSMEYKELISKGLSDIEATAFLAGKDTVESTQFNYSAWARPKIMQGRKSALLTFFMFTQNMLWFIQNSPGRSRYLLMLLLFAGTQGMPGMEDLDEIVKGMGSVLNKDWDMERELRGVLTELTDTDPDWFLHGISRHSFGLKAVGDWTGLPIPDIDMSSSIGMGSPLPIVSPAIGAASSLVRGEDFNETLGKFSIEATGPTLGIPFAVMQTLLDSQLQWNDPKRWEPALPAAVSSMSKAYRYYTEGSERTRTGAEVIRYDRNDPVGMAEIAARALGFVPTKSSQAWDFIIMEREAEQFWTVRRASLYDQWDFAKEAKDREGIAAVKDAVRRYNASLPRTYRALRITQDMLDRSYKAREKTRKKVEKGQASSKMMKGVYREIERLHPELKTDTTSEPVPRGN